MVKFKNSINSSIDFVFSVHVKMASTSANSANTIYLTEIPPNENTVQKLCNYFSKFGNVLSVNVAHNGDNTAATVTFVNNKFANAALKCTDAVLNNRFIKVSSGTQYNLQYNLRPTTVQNSVTINDVTCNICFKTYSSQRNRDRHLREVHKVGLVNACTSCKAIFESANAYKKHCIVYHSMPQLENKNDDATRTQNSVEQKLRRKIKSMKEKLLTQDKMRCKQLKLLLEKKKKLKQKITGSSTNNFLFFCAYKRLLFSQRKNSC